SFGPPGAIGRRHDGGDGLGEAGPRGRFSRERVAALGSDLVILGAAVVQRESPRGLKKLALLEAVKCGVERALFDSEDVAGDVLDQPRDAVAVGRPPRERLEDEEVERALEEVERGAHRISHRMSLGIWERPLECQWGRRRRRDNGTDYSYAYAD